MKPGLFCSNAGSIPAFAVRSAQMVHAGPFTLCYTVTAHLCSSLCHPLSQPALQSPSHHHQVMLVLASREVSLLSYGPQHFAKRLLFASS